MWDKMHSSQTIMVIEEIHETFTPKLAYFLIS